ncbi:uncharacterized protein LOC117653045 [Thrips palmi]|uniref:Uncharacterized protein LOC117653045 n=1 Tax=Thrips palmi TaxID=161013 RepID=A0A6P9A8F2_THRPL|nr:uncharacterized protein LOC117653045 [Thrips palmi]
MWLVSAAAVAEAVSPPLAHPLGGLDDDQLEGHQQQGRHLDVQSILDPTGMVSHFGETLGQAGRVLGLRIADSVADLVSSAFGHAPTRTSTPYGPVRPAWTRGDPGVVPAGSAAGPYYQPQLRQPPPSPSVLGGILRLLGLDSSKLGAIALNGVIFLAQLISSSIVGRPAAGPHARSGGGTKDEGNAQADDDAEDRDDDPDDDQEPAGTPLSWMLDNPAIKQAEAPDTSCIQLLVCKAGPFLDGMQRSLRPALRPRWRRMTPVQRMFAHMPSAEEVLDRADTCAQRFPKCKVSY